MASASAIRGALIVIVGIMILLTALDNSSFGANSNDLNLAGALLGVGVALFGLFWIWHAGGFSKEDS